MSRIDRKLAACIADDRKILIPFITAGDPSLESTVPVMHAMVRAGADIIELGVPFSDPMADGPVIQKSSERAIAKGGGLRHTLECVREFRRTDNATPVVLMGYLNPVDILGAAAFAATAVESGVDGVLLVDLPPEEAAPFLTDFASAGLQLITLISPTTAPERWPQIINQAEGYLYYVSYSGVTGTSAALAQSKSHDVLSGIREMSPVPVVAGFGISDAPSAAAMAGLADGVVIGSALVSAMAENPGAAAEVATRFLAPIRAALDAIQ